MNGARLNGASAEIAYSRRKEDLPLLVVSQDYELFFQDSGSIEKCLLEPCDLLLRFAEKQDMRVTFFVDAGMLVAMEREAPSAPALRKSLDTVRSHIESLASAGHEIGLHVHPHWEDSVWTEDAWQFAGSRYQLRDFSEAEVSVIFDSYSAALKDLCDGNIRSYRAGGFCIEPFDRIAGKLRELGITVDSSVVPGAVLKDDDKGFDFRDAPDEAWWRFSESPVRPDPDGDFIEIPVTPSRLPLSHYWGRLAERLIGHRTTDMIGDGRSKALGKREVVRRLMGAGRVSELSIDAPKAEQLLANRTNARFRKVWQVMGHPKLLGESSLKRLERFMQRTAIKRATTVSGLADRIRAS